MATGMCAERGDCIRGWVAWLHMHLGVCRQGGGGVWSGSGRDLAWWCLLVSSSWCLGPVPR